MRKSRLDSKRLCRGTMLIRLIAVCWRIRSSDRSRYVKKFFFGGGLFFCSPSDSITDTDVN